MHRLPGPPDGPQHPGEGLPSPGQQGHGVAGVGRGQRHVPRLHRPGVGAASRPGRSALIRGAWGPRFPARMAETLLEELKRYVGFGPGRRSGPARAPRRRRPRLPRHRRGLLRPHPRARGGARQALVGRREPGRPAQGHAGALDGEALGGPWDEAYWEAHCRIGRVHVRIDLPQHYMFGAMNVVREELGHAMTAAWLRRARLAGADPGGAREDPRPRAGHHAPHLPRRPAGPAGPGGAAHHLRPAGRLHRPRPAQPAGGHRDLALHPARPRRRGRARAGSTSTGSRSSSTSPTASSPTCST